MTPTTKEINDANGLIADVMGIELTTYTDSPSPDYDWINGPPGQIWPYKNPPPFHDDWNWLMPAWLKIQKWYSSEFGLMTSTFEASSIGIMITARDTTAFRYGTPAMYGELRHEDYYRAVVAFAKWYKVLYPNQKL